MSRLAAKVYIYDHLSSHICPSRRCNLIHKIISHFRHGGRVSLFKFYIKANIEAKSLRKFDVWQTRALFIFVSEFLPKREK